MYAPVISAAEDVFLPEVCIGRSPVTLVNRKVTDSAATVLPARIRYNPVTDRPAVFGWSRLYLYGIISCRNLRTGILGLWKDIS